MINTENKIYVGAIGLAVICDIGVDMSLATDIYFQVRKPDGTEVTWPAAPHAIDGDQSYLKYDTRKGDLDQRGRYKIQPRMTLVNWTGHGETSEFRVEGRYR